MNLKRVRLSICWILSPVGRSVEGLSRVVMGDRLNWNVVFLLYKADGQRLIGGHRTSS